MCGLFVNGGLFFQLECFVIIWNGKGEMDSFFIGALQFRWVENVCCMFRADKHLFGAFYVQGCKSVFDVLSSVAKLCLWDVVSR